MNPEIASILSDDDLSWELTLEELCDEKEEQKDFNKCRDCPVFIYIYDLKSSLKFKPL